MVHSTGASRALAPALFAFICLAMTSCAHARVPFVVALPNGYYLERDASDDVRLVRRNGSVVVRGPIAGYAVDRHIVTGLLGRSPRPGSAYPNDTPLPEHAEGEPYFILDTQTGSLETGLGLAEWKRRLEALGVKLAGGIRAPVLPG